MKKSVFIVALSVFTGVMLFAQKTHVIKPALAIAEPMDMNCTVEQSFSFLREMKVGWNDGNSLDAWKSEIYEPGSIESEVSWGNPRNTQALFDAVKQAGFGVVRLPVTWMGHFDTKANGYRIDEAYLARVAQVVGYAHAAGLKVIINIHHDGVGSEHWLSVNKADDSPESYQEVTDTLCALWFQIASYFKNNGDYLIFEGFNEIQDGKWGWGVNRTDGGKQYAVVNKWNQAFVDTVRGTGGNNTYRYLVVQGYDTNIDLTVSYLILPKDATLNRLIVSVHYYDPYEYTLEAKYPAWGSQEGDAPATECTSYGQERDMKANFTKLKKTYIDKGVPVYIGECGCTNQRGSEKYRRYYVEYLCKTATDLGLLPIFWDNGYINAGSENEGLFKRSSVKQAFPKIIKAIMRGVSGETSVVKPGSDLDLD